MCGFPGGREACQTLFDDVALRVRALAWTDSMKTWRLMHDVYYVQHAEEFCTGFDKLATHLGGICLALEHSASEKGYRALQKLVEREPWKGQTYPPEPGLPGPRGSVTVASLRDGNEPERLISGVDRWARATWLAFADLQSLVRDWVKQAALLGDLGGGPGRR